MKNWKRRLKSFVQQRRGLLYLYHLLRPAKRDSHNHVLLSYAQSNLSKDIQFIQIGAHEGGLHDPLDQLIRLYGWTGLFVEPQEAEMNALQASYLAFPKLRFAQSAVSNIAGDRKFYRINPKDNLPHWVSQLSSFYQEVPAAVLKDYPEAELVEEIINCVTIQDLISRHGLDRSNILLIDTEGHDGEILRSIDFSDYRPEIILFEHYHLTTNDLENTLKYLSAAGYQFWPKQANTLAVLSSELRELYPGVWQDDIEDY